MASQFAMRMAAHHIRNNGIIIYPTETVYGLGCDPDSHYAITMLNKLKQRDSHSTFLLLASHMDQLTPYIQKPDDLSLDLINTTQIATSWITTANKHTPSWLTTREGSIGFRITRHPVAKQLCDLLDSPIISTSANFRGRSPVSNSLQCHQMFDERVNYILTSNDKSNGTPSIIRKLNDGSRIR